MLRRRTSAHSAANPAAGFSQLRIQAFQASYSVSAFQPGSSDQGTGTQRLLGWVMASARTVLSGGTGAGGGAVGRGARLAQEASIPTITSSCNRCRSRFLMGLILLEALLALVILVGIVWWTMFSGRKKGEPPTRSDDDQA